MKKFLVLTAIFAAMFLVISCGGSDSDDDNKGNNSNNEEGNSEEGNSEEGNNEGENNEAENNNDCTKITLKWSEAVFGDEDEEEYEEFYMYGSYVPRSGTNSEYDDIIEFDMEPLVEANKEYDFASTNNPKLYILEDFHPSTEEEFEETEHDNQWNGAYLAVSGKVKINSLDMENKHVSLSFKNVKLLPAKIDRETQVWTLTGDESKCLFIESSSFEK